MLPPWHCLIPELSAGFFNLTCEHWHQLSCRVFKELQMNYNHDFEVWLSTNLTNMGCFRLWDWLSYEVKCWNGAMTHFLSEVRVGLCVRDFPVVWIPVVTVRSFLDQEHVWPSQPVSTAPGDCHHIHVISTTVVLIREDDLMSSKKPVFFPTLGLFQQTGQFSLTTELNKIYYLWFS